MTTLPVGKYEQHKRAHTRLLPDRRRAHFQDGPIDLIIEANGAPSAVLAAYRKAAERFQSVLDELCAELDIIRAPVAGHSPMPDGRIARQMHAAVTPYKDCFITPMAAVAGAVAQDVLSVLANCDGITRAYVNNGGDIALHLSSGLDYSVALVDHPLRPEKSGHISISSESVIRGIATSGRHGRSFSLGIADAVTVLARTAAEADAAATIVANAVDLPGHASVHRMPARELQSDSDLRAIPVTVNVGPLRACDIEQALDSGQACASRLVDVGLIEAAALRLQGATRLVMRDDASPFVMSPFVLDRRLPTGRSPIGSLRLAGM